MSNFLMFCAATVFVNMLVWFIYVHGMKRTHEQTVRLKDDNFDSLVKCHRDYIKMQESRKIYTFDSATDRIENVVFWIEDNQHLRLTLVDGSIYVISTPVKYKLIIQDQSEEIKSK